MYSDVTSVNSVCVSDKIINYNDNFRIKCLFYSKINAILCVLYFLFLHFFIKSWKTCQLMWENFVFLVIFDTCDVVHNWSISLLPPILYLILYLIKTMYQSILFLFLSHLSWKWPKPISFAVLLSTKRGLYQIHKYPLDMKNGNIPPPLPVLHTLFLSIMHSGTYKTLE